MSIVKRGIVALAALCGGAAVLICSGAAGFAVAPKDKMAICKFGAEDQKLAGSAREAFIKKCMANKNDPRGPAGRAAPAGSAAVPPPPRQ